MAAPEVLTPAFLRGKDMIGEKPRPTGAAPKTIDGVIFRCYRTGIGRYEWRSDDNRLATGQNYHRGSYYAAVGLQRFDKRFRSLENAMKFAVQESRK